MKVAVLLLAAFAAGAVFAHLVWRPPAPVFGPAFIVLPPTASPADIPQLPLHDLDSLPRHR